MIGVIFATEEEAQPFLERYERGRFDGLTEGEAYHDEHTLVTITGQGKIKATFRTERLLQEYRLSHLVDAGGCTTLSDDIAPETIVGVRQVFEGDRIELAAPTYPRMPLATPFGALDTYTLVTQDHTPREAKERSYWQRIAELTDMKAYAVAYVAAMHGVPCACMKVVTGALQSEDLFLRRTLDGAYTNLAERLVSELKAMRLGAR
jgi:nucleoside phosphorylase